MKKASNKIPILKDCLSNKQIKANKKIFCISCIRVVTIHFTKLNINSGKHGTSKNKFTTHKEKLLKRGLDAKETAVIKDKMGPKCIMKKRKL